MACRLFCAKPLSEPLLTTNFSEIRMKTQHFSIHENSFANVVSEMTAFFIWLQCVNIQLVMDTVCVMFYFVLFFFFNFTHNFRVTGTGTVAVICEALPVKLWQLWKYRSMNHIHQLRMGDITIARRAGNTSLGILDLNLTEEYLHIWTDKPNMNTFVFRKRWYVMTIII